MASSIGSESVRARRLGIALGLTIALGLSTGVARGQPARPDVSGADHALAQSLFDRGRELMEKGDFPSACPLLAESQRIDPAGGTLTNLAVCHEQAGKLATAYAEFNEALSQAIREGRKDRQKIAEERIAAIAPRLSKIAIDVGAAEDVPGLEVRLDGTPVGRAAWGTLTAADGGSHKIDASAPGRKTWTLTLQLPTASAEQRVRVPVLVSESASPVGTPHTPSTGSNAQLYWGVASTVVGGTAVAVGVVTAVVAWAQSVDLGIECNAELQCPKRLEGQVDSYHAFATVSTITLIGGAVLVAAGITLMTTAKPPHPKSASRPSLRLAPTGVVGVF
jgi:hypothetical protein